MYGIRLSQQGLGVRWGKHGVAALVLTGVLAPALAQGLTVTPAQRNTAEQVAQGGVPLADLAPDAPDQYTVKAGDTLWAIAGLYLRSPWRWPELWGMNLQDIRNPHRIYPGQQLYLDKSGGRARLRMGQPAASAGGGGAVGVTTDPIPTVRLSPRVRAQALPDAVIPPIKPGLIEPFLDEPLIVDEAALAKAARLVSAAEGRVLISTGDRAYARGTSQPLMLNAAGDNLYRVFRKARPLVDPVTRAVLGYEAQFVGRVRLARDESQLAGADGKPGAVVPATVDVLLAKEELLAGDRLLPEPPRQFQDYVPRAPQKPIEGAIVSVYGSAVSNAAQNQIVVINRGTADGVESGHVLAIQKAGARVTDRTDAARTTMQLPSERNGLLIVFRPFERLSYALILEITDGVEIGDRVGAPR